MEDTLIAINFYVGGISIMPIIQTDENLCQYFTQTCMTILLWGTSIIVIIENICVKYQLLQILLLLVVSDVIVIIFIIAGNNHKPDNVGSLG